MLTSPEVNDLAGALCAAQAEFKPIVKDKWNPHFSSNYADLASIRDATRPALAKYGLVVLQSYSAQGVIVTVITRIQHKSGQFMEGHHSAEARNGTAQSVAAAVTFMCRQGQVHMLNLSLGEDDDGNATQKGDGHAPDGPAPGQAPPDTARDVFDFETMQHELADELKSRNVPDTKWEAIGRWLHGKEKRLLSKGIASV